MLRKLIIQAFPLPLSSVKIGSLIKDPLHPHEDIQNGSTPLSLEEDCTRSDNGPRFESVNDTSKQNIFVSMLTSLSVFWKSSATSSNIIVADNTCVYELNNPTDRFEKLLEQENVKKWIQRQAEKGSQIWMITGIQTTLNQRVEVDTKSSSVASGSFSVDPTTVLPSKGPNPPRDPDSDDEPRAKAPNDANTSLKAGARDTGGHESFLSMSTEGERVVAVRIRPILIQEADEATLDDTPKNKRRWVMVGDQRGEEAVEQLVEAVLEDEDDDCGGQCEEMNVGDGEEKIVYVKLEDNPRDV